jgi:hypothetical protein
MKSVTAFVNKENYTAFTCPYCHHTHRISVGTLQDKKHSIVAKCICNERFKLKLNFRQFYRKLVNLNGEVLNVSSGSAKWYAITVMDLSMSGIRFKVAGPKNIEIGHRLHVRFTLDDKQSNVIDKELRVVDIKHNTYGCEFLNIAYEEKELGYYLFPNLSS